MSFVMGMIFGVFIGFLIALLLPTPESRAWDEQVTEEPAIHDEPVEQVLFEPKEYAVAGKPRRVPWSIRRAELEAKHRTKRKALEEWQ